MGYGDPLPTPSLVVHATFASIKAPEIHSFIQTSDQAAFEDKDEEDMHVPMLISTLGLVHWTAIMYVTTEDMGKGLDRLKQAHTTLEDILDRNKK